MQFTIREAKDLFFDRANVQARMSIAKRNALASAGKLVRYLAQRSMRKRRMKKLSEMTKGERVAFAIRTREAEREGRRPPKRPLASSRPGEPPRVRVGLLRQFLFFAYDPDSDSVVVGPALLPRAKGEVPSVLEYGGLNKQGFMVAARPYMAPAKEKASPQLVELFKGILPG